MKHPAYGRGSVIAYLAIFVTGTILAFLGGTEYAKEPTEASNEPIRVSCPTTEPTPYDPHMVLNRDNLMIKVNEERLKAGIQTLAVSSVLNTAAQKRAEWEAKLPEINHDGLEAALPRGSGRTNELIGKGAGTAPLAVLSFMNSPTHRAGLLDPLAVRIGIGVSGDVTVVWTEREPNK